MKQLLILFFGISLLKAQTKEIKIGQQVWMVENLNVDKFRNGEIIPEAKTDAEWKKAAENKQAAWCYYNNDSSNGTKYGKLYNWYAVNDPRGLAPKGWHIPSDKEWTDLTDYLGGIGRAGARRQNSVCYWGIAYGYTSQARRPARDNYTPCKCTRSCCCRRP